MSNERAWFPILSGMIDDAYRILARSPVAKIFHTTKSQRKCGEHRGVRFG